MAKPVDATGKRDNTAIFDPEQYGMVMSPLVTPSVLFKIQNTIMP
jgi:hypothetical protein